MSEGFARHANSVPLPRALFAVRPRARGTPRFGTGLVLAYFVCVMLADPIRQVTGFLLDEAAFALFFAVAITHAALRRDLRLGPPGILALVFAAYALLLSLYRGIGGLVLIEGAGLLVKPALVFMAAFNLSLDERAALGMPRTVGRFLSGVAVAVFAYSILFDVLLQANPIPGFPPPPQRFPFPIMRGLFSHAGNFASVMTICAIWSLSSFLFTKRPFDLFVFAAAASSVVGSQRIKGILFVCASLFLAVYAARFMKSGKARGVTVALGSAAVALLTFGMVWFLFDTLFPAERRFYFSEASDALRTKLLLAAVDIARATNGFGAGAGQWGSLTSITHYSAYYWRYGLALTYGATKKIPGSCSINGGLGTSEKWAGSDSRSSSRSAERA